MPQEPQCRAMVDKRSGHLDVVAARSPVQRSLFVPAALDRSVGIGPRINQHRDDLWAVREEPGPVGRRVERGAGPPLSSTSLAAARPERSASNTRSELTSPEWTGLTKAMAVPSAFDSLKPRRRSSSLAARS